VGLQRAKGRELGRDLLSRDGRDALAHRHSQRLDERLVARAGGAAEPCAGPRTRGRWRAAKSPNSDGSGPNQHCTIIIFRGHEAGPHDKIYKPTRSPSRRSRSNTPTRGENLRNADIEVNSFETQESSSVTNAEVESVPTTTASSRTRRGTSSDSRHFADGEPAVMYAPLQQARLVCPSPRTTPRGSAPSTPPAGDPGPHRGRTSGNGHRPRSPSARRRRANPDPPPARPSARKCPRVAQELPACRDREGRRA